MHRQSFKGLQTLHMLPDELLKVRKIYINDAIHGSRRAFLFVGNGCGFHVFVGGNCED
jgi:hypothetical protein